MVLLIFDCVRRKEKERQRDEMETERKECRTILLATCEEQWVRDVILPSAKQEKGDIR